MNISPDCAIVTQSLRDQNWYKALIEDCGAVIVEGVHASRWLLIETYHLLGTRLLEEWGNFERSEVYGQHITEMVAQDLGRGKRTVERAVQFAREYPDLNTLPFGKNASWSKVIRLLSDGEDKAKPATYYNGLGELVHFKLADRWLVRLPPGTKLEAEVGDRAVHIIIKEGP